MAISAPAFAQFVYLDTPTGVGGATPPDGLASCTSTSLPDDALFVGTYDIDIYFNTNHNSSGSVAVCDNGGNALTILSYEVSLAATGTGSVTFNKWTNNLAGYTVNLSGGTVGTGSGGSPGLLTGGAAAYIGLGSGTATAPGLYKLGTLNVTVTGNEVLSFLGLSSPSGVSAVAQTAFGTNCDATNFDNTYRLGEDFTDNCGTEPPTATTTNKTWGQIKDLYR
jgi:hypothetical protein